MKRGARFLMWVILGILVISLFTLATQYLWNWLVPDLFSGPAITFWQTLGLLLLCKIFFGGFGKNCHRGNHNHAWKQKYYNKFSTMSSEEREAFKKKMWAKWCPNAPDEAEEKPSNQ